MNAEQIQMKGRSQSENELAALTGQAGTHLI